MIGERRAPKQTEQFDAHVRGGFDKVLENVGRAVNLDGVSDVRPEERGGIRERTMRAREVDRYAPPPFRLQWPGYLQPGQTGSFRFIGEH